MDAKPARARLSLEEGNVRVKRFADGHAVYVRNLADWPDGKAAGFHGGAGEGNFDEQAVSSGRQGIDGPQRGRNYGFCGVRKASEE